MSMIEPVEKSSVAENVFRTLRDKILAGDYAPGHALPGERSLSKSLGVNRGAVRESLKRLEQCGLVEIQHGEHTRVTDFRRTGTLDLLIDLGVRPDGRVDIEVVRGVMLLALVTRIAVLRLATMRGGEVAPVLEAELGRLRAATHDPAAAMSARIAFWEALFHGSGELSYRMLWNSLRRVAEPCMRLWQDMAPVSDGEFMVLERVTRVVGEGDPDAAEHEVRELDERYIFPILAHLRELLEQGQVLLDPRAGLQGPPDLRTTTRPAEA